MSYSQYALQTHKRKNLQKMLYLYLVLGSLGWNTATSGALLKSGGDLSSCNEPSCAGLVIRKMCEFLWVPI